jgi:hypothetical protein
VTICITRDSVAAGDDADAPHAQRFEPSDIGDVESLVRFAAAHYPLASVSGGQATWVLSSGVPLAVCAQQWSEPRLVCWRGTPLTRLDGGGGGELGLHFSYLAQVDPEHAVAVLSRLRLRAER